MRHTNFDIYEHLLYVYELRSTPRILRKLTSSTHSVIIDVMFLHDDHLLTMFPIPARGNEGERCAM